jgi:flagellar protein FliO/FliZ
MSIDTYLRFALALVFVLALIAGAAWLARRFGLGGRLAAAGGRRRLAILEVLPLDAKRRLVLLRRDGAEHLILLGATGDLVVERGIAAPPAPRDFAAALEGETP